MYIEKISQILITTEDLIVKSGAGFITGTIFTYGGLDRFQMGILGSISELAKFILAGLIKFLGRTCNLKPSSIKYLQTGSNLLYDMAHIIALISLGYVNIIGIIGYPMLALVKFSANLKLARIQRINDYPFTSNNFKKVVS